jgi:hypothetical protein
VTLGYTDFQTSQKRDWPDLKILNFQYRLPLMSKSSRCTLALTHWIRSYWFAHREIEKLRVSWFMREFHNLILVTEVLTIRKSFKRSGKFNTFINESTLQNIIISVTNLVNKISWWSRVQISCMRMKSVRVARVCLFWNSFPISPRKFNVRVFVKSDSKRSSISKKLAFERSHNFERLSLHKNRRSTSGGSDSVPAV